MHTSSQYCKTKFTHRKHTPQQCPSRQTIKNTDKRPNQIGWVKAIVLKIVLSSILTQIWSSYSEQWAKKLVCLPSVWHHVLQSLFQCCHSPRRKLKSLLQISAKSACTIKHSATETVIAVGGGDKLAAKHSAQQDACVRMGEQNLLWAAGTSILTQSAVELYLNICPEQRISAFQVSIHTHSNPYGILLQKEKGLSEFGIWAIPECFKVWSLIYH